MPPEAAPPRRPAWGGAAVGLGLVALAGLVALDAARVARTPTYAVVGPTAAPYAVAAMLGVLGALLCLAALRGARVPGPAATAPGARLAWLLGGLALNVVAIERIGFILASTVLFAATARAFGSDRPARDAAIGFALAAVAWLAFARLLGVSLGDGPIEGLL